MDTYLKIILREPSQHTGFWSPLVLWLDIFTTQFSASMSRSTYCWPFTLLGAYCILSLRDQCTLVAATLELNCDKSCIDCYEFVLSCLFSMLNIEILRLHRVILLHYITCSDLPKEIDADEGKFHETRWLRNKLEGKTRPMINSMRMLGCG